MESRTYRQPGFAVTEHILSVPLDATRPDGSTVELFAREVVAADDERKGRPWLVFLAGGPGFEAPRPSGPGAIPWMRRALADFRVLLLDQRGTGRSTPVGLGDASGPAPDDLAERLAHHRADMIVADAEAFRRALGVERWSVLGQSFGGFCTLAYLSTFPESLSGAFIAGGLPPLDHDIDAVYAATYASTIDKTRRHYARYPQDRVRMEALVERVTSEDVRLPGGDRLTHARLRQLGIMLGMGDGSERLHHILELPTDSPAFLHDVERASAFARNPLYAVVHESCYASGGTTRWAAERCMPDEYAVDPALLTGEHIFPWMFEEIAGLAPFREAAHLLAERPWNRLYDVETLAANTVPCAAAVYVDDMYVPQRFSIQTAQQIQGMRTWTTNEFEHDGLDSGDVVLDRLIALSRGLV